MKAVTLARGTIAAVIGTLALVTGLNAWSQTRACLDRAPAGGPRSDFVVAAARQSPAVVSITVAGAGNDWAVGGDMPTPTRPGGAWAAASHRGSFFNATATS